MRKAPRIISRRKRVQLKHEDSDLSKEILIRDIDDEIGDDVIVRGGVMMRIVDGNDEQPEEVHDVEPISSFQQFSHHITVEAPALPYTCGPYKENPLPGTADEVESYPCSFCSDKPYLTDRFLLKHTETCHPEHLNQVIQEIAKIREEWERRYIERSRQRERVAYAKIRHDAISDAIANITASTSTEPIYEGYVEQEEDVSVERSFEPCQICGILVNALHPSAMSNHMRAHTKNDELRTQLIQTYGTEFVMRLTCHDCQLVFSDKRKLNAHIENFHSRKRKYVCKWCGTVCLSMSDLNSHKADVHGVPVSRAKQMQNARLARVQNNDRSSYSLGLKNVDVNRKVGFSSQPEPSTSTTKVTPVLEDIPCRTTCELCGLMMVKPSLLVRHMLRVHCRRSFTATIEIKGMPCIRVDVDGGKLTWWCCELGFNNRFDFLYHRRSCHQPKFEFLSYPAEVVDTQVLENCDNVDEINDGLVGDERIMRIDEATAPSDAAENLYVLLVTDSNVEEKDDVTWGVMPMDGDISSDVQQITLTAEQYEQLRLQTDGNLSNMQVMVMNEVVNTCEDVIDGNSGNDNCTDNGNGIETVVHNTTVTTIPTNTVDSLNCTPSSPPQPPFVPAVDNSAVEDVDDDLDSAVPIVDIDASGPPALPMHQQRVQSHGTSRISAVGHDGCGPNNATTDTATNVGAS
uniref:C2H2-type domain-containing protein n=1 Tax=Syphacia muris TaxID=451379 RepID=A0A0N5AHK4_9BILA